ncbi:MAG TPA: MFS transporter [Gaiellaceae bacterium]
MRLPDAFEPLRERDFRLLFLGQAVSWLGTGMVGVALSFAVLDVTHSVSDLGFVFAARSVPMVVFLVVGGVFADRLPRRGVMIAADLVRLGSQGLLAGLLVAGVARLWEIVVLVTIGGAATAFFNPAVTGLVAQVVSPQRLQQANALRSVSASLGGVLGPAVAGALVATVGAGYALGVDAATFGVSAYYLARLRLPPDERLPAQAVLRDLADGWREFKSRTWLVTANVEAALANALVLAPYTVLGPVVSKRSLGGAGAWAVISAAFGAGSILGGVVALRYRPRRPLLVGLATTIVNAPLLAFLALRFDAIAVAVFAILGGASLTFLNTVWETTIQEQIPARFLSRITAYDLFTSIVAYPLGLALAGILAAHVLGVGGMLWLGAGTAVALSTVIFFVPSIRELRSRAQSP